MKDSIRVSGLAVACALVVFPGANRGTPTQWVKRAQENAAKAVEEEKQKAKK